MQRIATFAAAAAFGALALGAVPGFAQSLASSSAERDTNAAAAIEASAQARSQQVRRRARTQLWVYPRYPYRTFHTFYPLPYPIEFPGPNAVRHCVSSLVPEYRPSGTVIVPRMRCWWARS